MNDIITSILLGIVEGVTEFLPVSSTGHLILAGALLGFKDDKWALFDIVIQLGAILAVVVLYWRTFWGVLQGLLARDAGAIRFVANLLIAFVPAVVIGLLFRKQIEALLLQPMVVAIALILGGVAILVIERLVKPGAAVGIAALPVTTALGIGVLQCLAMIPGVSRSGATILGALTLGVERRTAAEFSFFLAIPTMLGASTVELAAHHDTLAAANAVGPGMIALGFVVAFIVALLVVRWFVGIVSRHGFAPFAWYRIVIGGVALVWLLAK
ncbi:undecaprenyl-diphosphate phosphatase [Sphingomonas sp.]|uniref:undecaprenyl-diphosphate phosphatase n=1 Tax=Sphingomonas sp. TaxID=28214 RepID=UPI001DD049E9|nr:undecaprenyl-diphosphate phosphatase [Sphingomonas sp.]MBX9795767.1 undecaprenyl-diphosphate phosphatase [Sphingomonas sp.]